jgi:folate-dependent phosphoribosylglycinamide formyltransferase PurN
VHPADLRVRAPDGRRLLVGAHAVRDAIAAGRKETRSTVHLVTEDVDGGPILVVSPPLAVDLRALPSPMCETDLAVLAERHQDEQKRRCDWPAYTTALRLVAEGAFAFDDSGRVYFRGKPAPDGHVMP